MSPVPWPAVPHGSEQGMRGAWGPVPLPCILQAAPFLPFLRARGLTASCQPQGFPASAALPGIAALGFQLSVVNPKEKKGREGREEIYSFHPSLAYVPRRDDFFWSRQEVRQRWWRKRGTRMLLSPGVGCGPLSDIFQPSPSRCLLLPLDALEDLAAFLSQGGKSTGL